jgi:hypothetical protein
LNILKNITEAGKAVGISHRGIVVPSVEDNPVLREIFATSE